MARRMLCHAVGHGINFKYMLAEKDIILFYNPECSKLTKAVKAIRYSSTRQLILQYQITYTSKDTEEV